jgi:ABC-type antimicrobial peptide transport system permease subunit
MTSLVEASLGQPRFNTVLLTVFAAIATLLAASGVYGVMSFAVATRTQEIAVRMALGADRRAIVGLVLGAAFRMTMIGIASGTAVAVAAGRAMRTMLFGVNPVDPAVFATVAAFIALVALVACGVPALRAVKLDSTIALRGARC